MQLLSSTEAKKVLLQFKSDLGARLAHQHGNYYKAANSEALGHGGFYFFFRDSPPSIEIGQSGAAYPIVAIAIGDRAEGGVAQDESGSHFLVRRPGLGGNRARISRDFFMQEYRHEIIEITGVNFARICSLEPLENVPQALCQYAKECQRIRELNLINPDLATGPTDITISTKTAGFDPGISQAGTRSSACFEALHHPIAIELKKQMGALGFHVRETERVRPDLHVSNGDISILFEIKPEARSHDLMLACGQLSIYNYIVEANRMILVTKKPTSGELIEAIRGFMEDHRIQLLEYASDAEQNITFPDLNQVLF